ncbi:phosphopantetheine-binding protein [Actinacidiphila soli]|uniref:phosphopantetheine-binding protein n=1 Tax=Actinacidiphila soli TaxID=2487275 RepID=UPI000FCC5D78|nr:phosphopantetheine-binding protein [Actinacidiphila soli]
MEADSMINEELYAKTKEIWEKVLDAEIDTNTDFFGMGGHSFMAMQIMVMLEETCESDLPMRILFDHPRFGDFVAALAEKIGADAK